MRRDESKKAKQIIKEIIRQAGGRLDGKTRLYKAFYLAHLFYFERSPGLLSDWPIVKMPNGPGIDDGDILIDSMVAAGEIALEHVAGRPLPGNAPDPDGQVTLDAGR